ncbi:hypothetical protein [Kutzneria chonburiensis]|uniref:Secreted protein n=1 Tax=Kutzneria chonburiensis TaxID=1483604 RepID=A0ABV6N9J5_9PSEU|nr:hypothetical protein [Kutzneria chonburiensis]
MRKLAFLLAIPLLLGTAATADAATGTVHLIGGSHADLKNPTTGQCVQLAPPYPGPRGIDNHTNSTVTIYLNSTCTSDDTARLVPPGKSYEVSSTWYPIISIVTLKVG